MKTKAENGQYFQYTFDAGDIVRYSKPEAGEENFLFRVIEDNGNRVHIEDMSGDYALPPQEMVAPEELALVTAVSARRDFAKFSKAEIAACYHEQIGYDPFVDSPSISVEEVRQTLVEYFADLDSIDPQ